MKTSSIRSSFLRHAVAGVLLMGVALRDASADAVTDWNAALESTLAFPSERGPAVPSRTYAILHAAMFDAVNGIARHYEPLHVTDTPPPGARAEAAAIQAAFTVLTALRPGHQAVWDAQLATSLAALPGGAGNSASIARGRAWGTTVANAILTWRTGDVGTIPATVAGPTTVGSWLFTPETRPFAGRNSLVTTPFLIANTASFDPGPPYGFANRADALASASYAADVNEVQARGGATSTVRTADEEYEALFLHAADQASLNRLLRSLVSPNARLADNARAFALVNIAYFDATIALFQSKYLHQLWRPFQAVNHADLDNNAATTKPGTTWAPLRTTPPHPEYPSAHVTLFTAMLRIMSRLVGDLHAVEFHAPGYASPLTYESLAAISDASVDARVDIGFHFRETGEISQIMGRAIADHLIDQKLRPRAPGKLVNLSVRGNAGTGNATLIAGFVISDVAKQVLARGIGPGLEAHGLSGALADPKITVFNSSGTVVAENDNWSSSSADETAILTLACQQTGAFPLTSGSADAALLTTLPPGSYTVHASAVGNTSGVALLEAYELQ